MCCFFLTLLPLANECTKAWGRFAKDELTSVKSPEAAEKSTKEHGYSVPLDLLQAREISICPIPRNFTLEESGMEVLSVRNALHDAGISEKNVNLHLKSHRVVVGQVLLTEISKHYNMSTFHVADTSRVDGGASYGEATVRNTGSRSLRKAHYAFHIDKFLPGICHLHNCSSNLDAVNLILDSYYHLWAPDMEREYGIGSLEKKVRTGTHVNVWVSLTSGEIEQSPLALVQPESVLSSPESFHTMIVNMPGVDDYISLLKLDPSRTANFFWIPNMKFGDVLMFLTWKTAHSAVRLLNKSTKSRQSAEMRMLLLEFDGMEEEVKTNNSSYARLLDSKQTCFLQ